MKRLQFVALASVIFFFLAPFAIQAATIGVAIGNDHVEVPTHYVPYNDDGRPGGAFVIGSPENPRFTYANAEGMVTLEGELDPDPSEMFAIAVTDFGAPSVFGFTFILPLAPVFPNPSSVFDSLSGSVTNGAAAGGVTVTALAPPAGIPTDGDGVAELQVYTLSDDGGVTYKNVGLDAGPTTFVPLGAFASGLYGVFNQGPIPTIAGGPWTHMRADLNFGLSGGGDAFTLNGAKVLIPEPGALFLGLSAAVLCCFFRPPAAEKR